jgi:hypothetical protein
MRRPRADCRGRSTLILGLPACPLALAFMNKTPIFPESCRRARRRGLVFTTGASDALRSAYKSVH